MCYNPISLKFRKAFRKALHSCCVFFLCLIGSQTVYGEIITPLTFGYGTLRSGDRQAPHGKRKVIVALVENTNLPPFEFPDSYYQDLIFGQGSFEQRSVSSMLYQQSRFGESPVQLEAAGGPLHIRLNQSADACEVDRAPACLEIKQAIMQALGADIFNFDIDNNGIVTDGELMIVTFSNETIDWAPRAGKVRDHTCTDNPIAGLPSLCSGIAILGQYASFSIIAHEQSHLFGTFDAYGAWALHPYINSWLSLMGDGAGSSSNINNDTKSVYLDAWHRMRLGWIKPQIIDIGTYRGSIALAAPDKPFSSIPQTVILFDSRRGTAEYFMLEYRSPVYSRAVGKYDTNLPGEGLLVWRVIQDAKHDLTLIPSIRGGEVRSGFTDRSLIHLGAPSLSYGENGIWTSGSVTPPLLWSDGSRAEIVLQVDPFTSGSSDIKASVFTDNQHYRGHYGDAKLDFDGDGRADVYALDNSISYFWSNSTGPRQSLGQHGSDLAAIRFGDFDGDGKTDLLIVEKSKTYFSSGGTGTWQVLGAHGSKVEDLRFGDFDGDGKTDILTIADGKTKISTGGISEWRDLGAHGSSLEGLRFIDMNHDGKTDILTISKGITYVSYSGTGSWLALGKHGADINQLRFGDFDGDGNMDIFTVENATSYLSSGGTNVWRKLGNHGSQIQNLIFADVDGDGKTDVMTIENGKTLYSSAGIGAWRVLGQFGPISKLRF